VFERIDVEGGKGMGGEAAADEVEARLEWFTRKVIWHLIRRRPPLNVFRLSQHCFVPLRLGRIP